MLEHILLPPTLHSTPLHSTHVLCPSPRSSTCCPHMAASQWTGCATCCHCHWDPRARGRAVMQGDMLNEVQGGMHGEVGYYLR
jgi:hypothetical protein